MKPFSTCHCGDCLACEMYELRRRVANRRGVDKSAGRFDTASATAREVSRATGMPVMEVIEALAEGRSVEDLVVGCGLKVRVA